MERIANDYSFWDFKGQETYSDAKLLMSSPVNITLILCLYLWFVLKFGPKFMKNRPPLKLVRLLVVYNAIQVAIATYLCTSGFRFLWQHGFLHTACFSCRNDDIRKYISDMAHIYFLSKVVELLDTVFFVLRKKQSQISFLHVYHHTLMAFGTWAVVKYSKTDSIIFIGMINEFVHVIMYSYYALSVFPKIAPYLWWKKYITILQLVQFTLMFLHIIYSHIYSECPPSYILLSAVCFNTVLFMYLFGDFYLKSYRKRSGKRFPVEKNCKSGLNYIIEHRKLASNIN